MTYQVDRNVPVPGSDYKVEAGLPVTDARLWHSKRRYPFPMMAPGDSFSVSREYREKVAQAASQYARRHPGFKFTVGKVGADEWRCWRLNE